MEVRNFHGTVFSVKEKDKLKNSPFWKIINGHAFKDKKRSLYIKDLTGNDTNNVETMELGEEMYDYYKFKQEYDEQILHNIPSNKILNSTDDNLTEQPKEALQKLLDFQNCTKTSTKFGIKAIDCLIINLEQQKNKPIVQKTLWKIWLIIKIWFLIYIFLAIPCWCHRGWCCCCFRCDFCFPRKRILFAKQYYMNNPPGALSVKIKRKKVVEPITYKPTEFEEDAYKNLQNTIRNI